MERPWRYDRESLSVRGRSALDALLQGTDLSRLVAEVQEDPGGVAERLSAMRNVGRKTVDEIVSLLVRMARSAPAWAGTRAPQTAEVESSLREIILAADALAFYAVVDFEPSVRLRNVLRAMKDEQRASPTVLDYLVDTSGFGTAVRERPGFGAKCRDELYGLLIAMIAERLDGAQSAAAVEATLKTAQARLFEVARSITSEDRATSGTSRSGPLELGASGPAGDPVSAESLPAEQSAATQLPLQFEAATEATPDLSQDPQRRYTATQATPTPAKPKAVPPRPVPAARPGPKPTKAAAGVAPGALIPAGSSATAQAQPRNSGTDQLSVPTVGADLQTRLTDRFSALRDARQGAVFFIEHGLDEQDLDALRSSVQRSLRVHPIESGWWDGFDLSLLVAVTEEGYRYRGAGTDFWPLVEEKLGFTVSPQGRQRIKDLFVRATARFRGARPPSTAWAEAFHLIAWPITHALLPLEFHQPLAATLADLRVNASSADDATLYRAVRVAAPRPNARFATLLEDARVVVSLTRSILRREGYELSSEIVSRLIADLEGDRVARRGVTVARTIQRAAQAKVGSALELAPVLRIRGRLQLRLANDTLLLEASLPPLDAATSERLRRSLRRRRFAPQLWGASARIPSDQLLSGLPFVVKLTKLPEKGAPLFPELDAGELDAQDLAILQGFELELAPPLLFAVSAEGDVARQVIGATITGHRKYWALFGEDDDKPRGGRVIGDVGPLQCVELDPNDAAAARALTQLGFDVRLGVSVRFAGTPSLERGADVPTFVAGDNRVLVPQRLTGDSSLVVDVDGRSATAKATEVVRVTVEAGEHRVKVSSETDTREYRFRGVGAPPPLNASVHLELRSEERTIQALLGGRLSFAVDGAAPIEGLPLTVDLEASGRTFSATGPLGTVPETVSSEHSVMRALLSEDVRAHLSAAESVTLRARVGHVARAAWELERVVRACWWDARGEPKLLSEGGPLRFGVVSAIDPVRTPTEGAVASGTHLLAPVGLDQLDFRASAHFATMCVAPKRTQLHDLAIACANKPALERRRRGTGAGVGLEDLAEAYLRWALAETRSAVGEIHRGQVTARIEDWMTEVCCGPEWTQAESTLPHRSTWGLLEQVCKEMALGRDGYVELTDEQDAQVRRLAVEEIRRALPALWTCVGPPSELDDGDYEALDRACAGAYEELSRRYRARGQEELADALEGADPCESPDRWDDAFLRVRERSELRSLAAMLLPSSSAARLMALDVGEMSADEVADELARWAKAGRKAFAGDAPSRDLLKASYALWVAPELALSLDWRTALDALVAERAVARATRYLALRARESRWGRT